MQQHKEKGLKSKQTEWASKFTYNLWGGKPYLEKKKKSLSNI